MWKQLSAVASKWFWLDVFIVTRFSIAMLVYAALAALAMVTLTDQKTRLVTLAVLAMFAVKTLVHKRDVESSTSSGEDV